MITLLMLFIRHTRLALQELAPHIAIMTLPGGYLIALTGWVHRHWPLIIQRIASVAAGTVSAAR